MGERDARDPSFSEAPEIVTYLSMSLAVSPSLDRAMAFAAEHGDGPLARRLRDALWEVHLRGRTRIEDAFTAVADEWGARNPDVKTAFYAIAHGVRDGTAATLSRTLDRSRASVFDGTRRSMREYAAGLRAPTSALFALGVLLPLIVGSMVPMLSLGAIAPSSVDVVKPAPGNPLPWLLLLDVAFPVATFAFAHWVSSRRVAGASTSRVAWRRGVAPLAIVPFAGLVSFLAPSGMSPLLGFGGAIVAVSWCLHRATREALRDRKRLDAIEEALPDILFQLGGRLQEGHALEDSLLSVAATLPGTPGGDLFDRIAHALRLGGGTAEGSPCSEVLRAVGSRTVRASLEMIVSLARKNPEAAGRAALEMSGHLRDLRVIDQDLRAELRPTVEAMRATAAVFAPLVLGVTAALYGVLVDAFASMASVPMDPRMFELALGVYLATTIASVLWFAARIEGQGPAAAGALVARTLPVGIALFLAAVALAGLAL